MMDEGLRRLILLGREHFRANDYDAAERYLAQVVAQSRAFADVFNMLGCVYHARGELPRAQEAFEEAMSLNPGYTEAALNLAVTYNDQGKYVKAREVYGAAIRRTRDAPRSLDPFVQGKLANMHADLGLAYAETGLFPESVREYLKALELGPQFVDVRVRLAHVYRDMGDTAASLRELEIVKTMNPRFVPGRTALGTTLFSMGRREEALREWEAVLALEPGNRAARAYLQMARDFRPSARAVVNAADTADAGAPAVASASDQTLDEIFAGMSAPDDKPPSE